MAFDAIDLRFCFVTVVAVILLLVGIWHLVKGEATERIFKQPRNVRLAGGFMLLPVLPCIYWGGVYFWVLGALFAASAGLRLFFTQRNIRLQKGTYPRWVHGCIITVSAVVMWVAYIKST